MRLRRLCPDISAPRFHDDDRLLADNLLRQLQKAPAFPQPLDIAQVVTKRVDTLALRLENPNVGWSIEGKQEIVVSNNAETVRYFAGYISNIKLDTIGISKALIISAQDYTVLLDTIIINEVYENQGDQTIIASLFTKYAGEFDATTYVKPGRTIERIVFYYCALREALEWLAEISGYDWYIDYNKYLHYFSQETNLAPFALSSSPVAPSSYPHKVSSYEKDVTGIVNRVIVIGGSYLSENTEFELAADGQQQRLALPYSLHAPSDDTLVEVYENTGSDSVPTWVELSVGIDYLDDPASHDCLYNYTEKFLSFTTAPPNLQRSIKVRGRYDVPILVRVRSLDSYSTYGRWYEAKVVDQDIDSRDWARLRGKAFLADKAMELPKGVTTCRQEGLVAGMRIQIVDSVRGINGYYLIQSIRTKLLSGRGIATFGVTFGDYIPDLVDMLVSLKRNAGKYQEKREDEKLNEVFDEINESVTLVDSTPTYTLRGTSGTHKYYAEGTPPIVAGFWRAS